MKIKSEYIIIFIWLICLFPITRIGYGSDNDAWRVAIAAEKIQETGYYIPSRTTGFPLFELIVTPLVNLGQWYLSNLLSLFFGVVFLLALIRLNKKGEFQHPNILLVSLIFLPIIVKNATSTMDYIPALSLLLWAYVCLVEDKWTIAGLLIGFACGFRPTSGLFVIPAALLIFVESKDQIQVFKLVLISVVCGVISYSPALLYGDMSYSNVIIQRSLQQWLLLTGYNYLRLFGIVQSLAIAIGFIIIIRSVVNQKKFNSFFLFHITNILVWTVLFLFMPDESEYLFPMIPSVIFILDKYLSKRIFLLFSLLLLSYHLIQLDAFGGQCGNRKFALAFRYGYTIQDIQDRIFKLSLREAANKYSTSTKTILIAGYPVIPADNDTWIIGNDFACQRDGNFCVSSQIRDESKLEILHSEGYDMVAWTCWANDMNKLHPDYVEMIDNLTDFFENPIIGKALVER